MMRNLFFVVVALGALYAGYWFVGQRQVEARAVAALAELEAQGWEVGYDDLSTTGFPSRFDTTVTDLRLASPDGQVEWEAPFLQVFALSYRPNRVIAAWPPEQRVTVAGETVEVASEGLRASAHVGLSAALPLRSATVESGPLKLDGERGWSVSLDRLLAAIREAGPAPASYDVFLEAGGIGSPSVAAGLDLLRLDALLTLDAPLDRTAAAPPGFVSLALRNARLAQGELAVTGSGALEVDAEGFLAGRITLVIENWRAMLELAREAGLLAFDRRALFEAALEQVSQGRDSIEVPVAFENGQVVALGLPLLAAPRVR